MSQLFVDNIKNRTGGAIGAPSGAVVTGVATATQFSGNVTGVAATFTGNVSIGGTLTYEDVTNIDSVGIVTARAGLRVNAGGLVVTAGVSTLAADLSIADKIIHTGDTNTAIRFPAADTFTVETAGSERLRITSAGKVGINSTSPGDNLSVSGGNIGIYNTGNSHGNVYFYKNNVPTAWFKYRGDTNAVIIGTNAGDKVTIDSSGNLTAVGTVSDSIGPLRRLGVNAQSTTGTYTFVVGDAGRIVRSSGSTAALHLDQNIFTAGDMISVFNVSSGNNTIVSGTGVTLYNTADAATGTRTIAAKGMVTIVCTATNEFAISGSQLT